LSSPLIVMLAEYLSNLRNNRPARPLGSRPLPGKANSVRPSTEEIPPRSESAFALRSDNPEPLCPVSHLDDPLRSASSLSFHSRQGPGTQLHSSVSSRTSIGRPLVADPSQKSYSIRGRKVSPTATIEAPAGPTASTYRESGARWIERQEAISLREALEEMDQQEEEKRIHAAAQDEAADLVWKHLNPGAADEEKNGAYFNPDIQRHGKKSFTAHLRKGAYSRSQQPIMGEAEQCLAKSDTFTSTSGSSNVTLQSKDSSDGPSNKPVVSDLRTSIEGVNNSLKMKPAADGASELTFSPSRRRTSSQRKVSSGSGKVGFPNPEERIYEDSAGLPSQTATSATPLPADSVPLRSTNRNSLLRGARPLPGQPAATTGEKVKSFDRFEIHKNSPSQSRTAGYTKNIAPPVIDLIPEVDTPPSKNGKEIRSDDIRAATSMKLKDRSPKLPLPTAVSDRPGRPIVSFDPGWKPESGSGKSSLETERPGPTPNTALASLTASAPMIPTINISGSDELSTSPIGVSNDDSIPSINVSVDEPLQTASVEKPSTRPLPQPSKTMPAKVPTAKLSSRLPWLNPSRYSVPTATCANCTLPISGRVVTASGAGSSSSALKARFHPECFTCHHCSTALECIAFYPEPEDKRVKRIKAEGLSDNDAEQDFRFYCHLDFHEFFSPRCRSCKTPIEGEVIVAAGAEWHVGHFFCSECGDPFDSNTPFVEKDNYAYCVSCHTRRTSARCKACKKQILDEMTVQALGGQWHSDCFNCYECGGGFGDDGRFFVRNVTVEATEKEKRRGLKNKIEERAVCDVCEQRRLKA
jgi:LIM domain